MRDLREIVQSREFAAAIDDPKSPFRSFQKPQWLLDKLKAGK